MRKGIFVLLACALVGGALAQSGRMAPSLYAKYGIHKIAAAISEMVEAQDKDAVLLDNARFKGCAAMLPKPLVKFAVTAWVAKNLGGQQTTLDVDPGSLVKFFDFDAAQLREFTRIVQEKLVKNGFDRRDADAIAKMNLDWIDRAPMIQEEPKGEMFADPSSLYARLGGLAGISMVVDTFVDRLASDPVIGSNPRTVQALTSGRITAAGLKYLLTEQVAMATGGKIAYTGRSMKESHAKLGIEEKEWAASAAIFKKVLDDYKVPEREQGELFSIIGSTKKDIVAK